MELRSFWCGNEGCVELRGFGCVTEGFLVLNQGVFGLELRGFGAGKEWPFCVELMFELRGTHNYFIIVR